MYKKTRKIIKKRKKKTIFTRNEMNACHGKARFF